MTLECHFSFFRFRIFENYSLFSLQEVFDACLADAFRKSAKLAPLSDSLVSIHSVIRNLIGDECKGTFFVVYVLYLTHSIAFWLTKFRKFSKLGVLVWQFLEKFSNTSKNFWNCYRFLKSYKSNFCIRISPKSIYWPKFGRMFSSEL